MSELYYQETRGSMAQFETLRPDHLQAAGSDFTYDQLSQELSAHALSVGHVIHSSERALLSTYYADWNRGLYCEISLQPGDWDQICRTLLRLSDKLSHGNQNLLARDWELYYRWDVPVPMLIYDFQHRYMEIEENQVFAVWHAIYKRIDYSNGGWNDQVLEYVFSRAPVSALPAPEQNGLVTIYRGMGELSQPPETAISWSTHPGNALWFANHSGRGTRLVIAEVSPANIVAYFPGFYHENEVLVKPHTVQNIRSADMLPATQEVFIRLAAPMLLEFKRLGQLARRLGYSETKESIFNVHGVHHILRVLFLSLVYFYHSGDDLTVEDKAVLIYFSILHDVGRTTEDYDEAHGDASVELIHNRNLRIKGVVLSKKDYRIAELIIRYHCREDEQGLEAIKAKNWLSQREKSRASKLFCICKDMDGLDRVRFNGLDYRMLRTPFATRLPLIAGCLLKENFLAFLEMEGVK